MFPLHNLSSFLVVLYFPFEVACCPVSTPKHCPITNTGSYSVSKESLAPFSAFFKDLYRIFFHFFKNFVKVKKEREKKLLYHNIPTRKYLKAHSRNMESKYF